MYDIFVQLLKSNGVTAYQVAKATGIGNSTFSDWKSGRSTPKQGKLEKIARYFNVSVDYLLGKTDDPRTSAQMLEDSIQNQKMKLVAHGGDGTQYIDPISREEYESFFPQSAKRCVLRSDTEEIEISKEEFDKMKAFLKMIRE